MPHSRKEIASNINSHPARVRTHAIQGQGNVPGRTIEYTAHSIAARFGRRVHPRAKLPDKVAVWVLRPLRSSHPPRHMKAAQGRGTQRTGCGNSGFFHAAGRNIHPTVRRRHHLVRTRRRNQRTSPFGLGCSEACRGSRRLIRYSPDVICLPF